MIKRCATETSHVAGHTLFCGSSCSSWQWCHILLCKYTRVSRSAAQGAFKILTLVPLSGVSTSNTEAGTRPLCKMHITIMVGGCSCTLERIQKCTHFCHLKDSLSCQCPLSAPRCVPSTIVSSHICPMWCPWWHRDGPPSLQCPRLPNGAPSIVDSGSWNVVVPRDLLN